MDKICFGLLFAACLLLSFPSLAELKDFQTTRLISTGGAGVGSVLMDEATILNPAPLAFFTVTSFYVQKTKAKIEETSAPQIKNNSKTDNWAFVASDGNGNMGASLSYQTEKNGEAERKRLGLAFGFPADKTSAMGVAVRRTTDRDTTDKIHYTEDTRYQFIGGVTHAISSAFTLGLIVIDPTKRIKNETRAVVGLQYVYEEFIALMLDGGTDYTQKMRENAQYHAAIQFKVFSDVYLRFGAYEDKAKRERGNGAGLGWVSPKLVFEAALGSKTYNAYEKIRINKQESTETSFSLSYRF